MSFSIFFNMFICLLQYEKPFAACGHENKREFGAGDVNLGGMFSAFFDVFYSFKLNAVVCCPQERITM